MKILQRNLNSTCYDVVTFLTQLSKSSSNFVVISSLVVKLLKKYSFGGEWDTLYKVVKNYGYYIQAYNWL